MHEFNEELNFVPLLPATPLNRKYSSTPLRRASSISLNVKHKFGNYNGNYEGDYTMFGSKKLGGNGGGDDDGDLRKIQNKIVPAGSRLDLIETDSDTDYKKELECYRSPRTSDVTTHLSNRMRLWQNLKRRLLTEERLRQWSHVTEKLKANFYCRKLYELLQLVGVVLYFVLRWMLVVLVSICNWSYGLWRSKTLLRNAARRLLWSMTLAKCGDASFFGLILLATPLLFVVSLLGFLLSAYCALKECLSRSGYFIRYRVF